MMKHADTTTELRFRSVTPANLIIEQVDEEAASHAHTEQGMSLHEANHEEYTLHGCRISHAILDNGAVYHTLITHALWLCDADVQKQCRRVLRQLILGYLERAGVCLSKGRVLVCGLGNSRISADALGPMVCDRIHATGADPVYKAVGMTEVYLLKPGVPSQSGWSTGEHINILAKHLGADVIITADAMAARTVKRLSNVVQITDGGILAGAGTGQGTDEISRHTMPCPVISIGVPTVIRGSLLRENEPTESADFLVSHSEIDLITTCYADLIADAINDIFASPLTEEQRIP